MLFNTGEKPARLLHSHDLQQKEMKRVLWAGDCLSVLLFRVIEVFRGP